MRYVALLRGVNLGRRNRVPMAQLRELLADLGYVDVSTFLQSGNALFTSRRKPAALAREIEQAVAQRCHVETKVLLRTGAELSDVVRANPLTGTATDPARLYVTFLSDDADLAALNQMNAADYAPEQFAAGERAVYVWLPDGVQSSRLGQTFWERRLGCVATSRNWNTVTKLAELAET